MKKLKALLQARLDRLPANANIQFRPRYTPGSPAWSLRDAQLVNEVLDEVNSYLQCLTGAYGEVWRERALSLKLRHVARAYYNRKRKRYVMDLVTGREEVAR